MVGFKYGQQTIDSKLSFKVNQIFRKTNPNQKYAYVCPLTNCRTGMNKKYYVKDHFRKYHPEIVPFLLKPDNRSSQKK